VIGKAPHQPTPAFNIIRESAQRRLARIAQAKFAERRTQAFPMEWNSWPTSHCALNGSSLGKRVGTIRGTSPWPWALPRLQCIIMSPFDRSFCVWTIAFISFVPALSGQQGIPAQIGPAHGTVNVILANGDTLVAVTDSMLTYDSIHGPLHDPSGVKLYRLDDYTIATMASLYSDPDPSGYDSLTASIPGIIADFVRDHRNMGRQNFAKKVQALMGDMKFKLSKHLRLLVDSHRQFDFQDPIQITQFTLELTVAGFDLDGSLRIADITLRPQKVGPEVSYASADRPRGSSHPECEFSAGFQQIGERGDAPVELGPVVHIVQAPLYCEIVGIPDVAESILAAPSKHDDDEPLQAYVRAKSAHRELSAGELSALAVDLAQRTVKDEQKNGHGRVGGDLQVAVLSKGTMVEAPKPLVPTETGSALSGNTFSMEYECIPGRPAIGSGGWLNVGSVVNGGPTQEMEAKLTNCTQPIDGMIFRNSVFTDSRLQYSGAEPLIFSDSNVVIRTVLDIGPAVPIGSPQVRHLICGFEWKAVLQNGIKLEIDCPKVAKAPSP